MQDMLGIMGIEHIFFLSSDMNSVAFLSKS